MQKNLFAVQRSDMEVQRQMEWEKIYNGKLTTAKEAVKNIK
jgi:hypothetical protein